MENTKKFLCDCCGRAFTLEEGKFLPVDDEYWLTCPDCNSIHFTKIEDEEEEAEA